MIAIDNRYITATLTEEVLGLELHSTSDGPEAFDQGLHTAQP